LGFVMEMKCFLWKGNPIFKCYLEAFQVSENSHKRTINLRCRDITFSLYKRIAEMPGVARVDHRTKCVSLVAISLSQNFETRNCWPA
jgi:hypothetical protein